VLRRRIARGVIVAALPQIDRLVLRRGKSALHRADFRHPRKKSTSSQILRIVPPMLDGLQ